MNQKKDIEHAQIEALANVMRCRFSRDVCGDYMIQGQSGNIHIDGAGYSVFIQATGARAWHTVQAKLAGFCELRQNGDQEGVFHMASLPTPTPTPTRLLCSALRVHKIKKVSAETLQRLRTMGKAHTFKSNGVRTPQESH